MGMARPIARGGAWRLMRWMVVGEEGRYLLRARGHSSCPVYTIRPS